MAVVESREIPRGRDGGPFESTRVFRVTTNAASDGDQTVLASGLVPTRGLQHPTNAGLFVTDVKARQLDGTSRVWIVTVTYGRIASGIPQLAKETNINPLVQRVKVEGRSIVVKRAVEKSRFVYIGTLAEWEAAKLSQSIPTTPIPVLTSAREVMLGLERDYTEFFWEVTYNVDQIPFFMTDYMECINSAPVIIRGMSLPRWTLKFSGFTHSDLLEQQIVAEIYQYYYQIRFNLHYKKDGWIEPRRDAGHLELVNGTDKQAEILVDGRKPAVPILLDGAGAVLANPTPETTQYSFWSDYEEKNMAAILAPLNIGF